MGWMASWVAVKEADKAEVLEHLGFAETGSEIFPGAGTSRFSCRQFPDGWFVVFSEDFDWVDQGRVLDLSKFGLAVGCQFEDKVEMTSSLCAAESGRELWRVFHNSTESIYRLDVTGAPPPELDALRQTAFEEQRQDGGEDSSTDFVHEVALELGKAICGYRADDETAPFSALQKSGASKVSSGQARPNFVAKLLGGLLPSRQA